MMATELNKVRLAGLIGLLAIALGMLSAAANAQSITLEASATQVEINEPFTLSILVNSPTKLAAGIAATIKLPDGLELTSSTARSWYQAKWRDASIVPTLNESTLEFAGALKGADTPCPGSCTFASFQVKATTNGTFSIEFDVTKTEGLTASQEAITFATFTNTTVKAGSGDSMPGDADNDGIPDSLEEALGLSPNSSDSDNDGIPDGDEDFDGDGISNAEEVLVGLDPTLFVGDVNGDRNITAGDATRILQFVAGLRNASSLGRGPDVSNSGGITAADATRILQVVAGLRTTRSIQR